MTTTYIPSSNTTTNGTALSSTFGDDVRLFKLIIGAPVNAGNIIIYSINNPVNGATTNIAAKFTLPTFSTTAPNPGMYVMDFGSEGLPLNDGGNIIIDQSMQVTALWGLNDDAQN